MSMNNRDRPTSTIPTLARPLLWILLLALFSIGIYLRFYDTWTTDFMERVESQRRQDLVQLVSVARSAVEPILSEVRRGTLSRDEALQRVRTLVRAMTYEDTYGKNYMFMSAYDGTMLVQPFEPAKEMTNQWDLRDDHGVYIVRELVKAARNRPEGAFVSYHYHLPGLHGTQEKLAYVVGLPEVGAYLGTGMYRQKAIAEQSEIVDRVKRGALWLVLAVLVPLSAAFLFLARRNNLVLVEMETRRRAEGALQESEERYRQLVENANSIILQWKESGEILYLNDYGRKFFGYDLEEIRGKHVVGTIVPETEETGRDLRAMIADIAARPGSYEKNVNQNMRRDGTKVWIAWTNRIVSDERGRVSEIFSVGNDITEIRRIQKQLEESEERFRTAVEMLPLGIAILNRDGVPDFLNRRFVETFGYTLDDIPTADDWFRLAYPDEDDRRKVRASWEAERDRLLLPGAKPLPHEFAVRCKDGTTKIVEFTQNILGNRMIILFNDVTERRRAEESLRLHSKRVEALLKLHQMTDSPLGEITDFAVEEAVRLTGSTIGFLALMNEDETVLTVNAWSRSVQVECALEEKHAHFRIAGTGLWGEAVRRRGVVLINDCRASIPWKKGFPPGHVPVSRFMSVPVFSESRIVLVAGVGNKAVDYDETDVRQLTLLLEGTWSLIERKRAQEELAETQTLLHMATDASPSGIVVADAPDVRIRMVNRAAYLIRGDSPSPLNGISVEHHSENWQIHSPDGRLYDPLDLPLSRAVLKGERVENELAFIRREDGSERWVLISASPIRNDRDEIVGGLAVFPDISELRQAQEALRESERKYRDLADNLPQALFETDPTGRVTYANRFVMDLFQYSPTDLERGIHALDVLSPADHSRAAEEIHKIMAGETEEFTGEFTAVKADNQEFPVIVHVGPIRRGGVVVGMRGTLIDMTERKRLEDQLLQAQKMEAIGTLAGGIAHDFNNILMGIQGYASLLNLKLDSGDARHEYIQRIEQQVRSASDLTRQLLGFARGGRYEVKSLDLNAILEQSSTMFGRTKKELSIHRSFQPNLWPVEADRGQIEQALLNLYLNAWQAMPGGGDLCLETANVVLQEEQVRAHGLEPGRYVRVSIADTGSGMDRKTRERIFEPFFSTKALGRGAGLGLAMVYGIVKGHGGFVTVDSEPDRGSVFVLHLPASEKPIVQDKGVLPGIAVGSETILLVDDEPVVREVNQEILEKLGYKVFGAGGGREALEVLAANQGGIHLVILDMVMPGMSGEETFLRIKELDPKIKVILSSGYSLAGEAQRIMEKGCDGFLQKPFTTAGLSQEIRKVLGRAGSDPGTGQES